MAEPITPQVAIIEVGSPVGLGNHIEVPADKVNWDLLVKAELASSLVGQGIGILCVLLGVFLFWNGIIGEASWSATFMGLRINDAAPGSTLFFIGLIWGLKSKFRAKVVYPKPPDTKSP